MDWSVSQLQTLQNALSNIMAQETSAKQLLMNGEFKGMN